MSEKRRYDPQAIEPARQEAWQKDLPRGGRRVATPSIPAHLESGADTTSAGLAGYLSAAWGIGAPCGIPAAMYDS